MYDGLTGLVCTYEGMQDGPQLGMGIRYGITF